MVRALSWEERPNFSSHFLKICSETQCSCWGGLCAGTSCPSYHPREDAEGQQHNEGLLLWQGHPAAAVMLCPQQHHNRARNLSQGAWWGLYPALLSLYRGKPFLPFWGVQGQSECETSNLLSRNFQIFCLGSAIASSSSNSNISGLPSYTLWQCPAVWDHRAEVACASWVVRLP